MSTLPLSQTVSGCESRATGAPLRVVVRHRDAVAMVTRRDAITSPESMPLARIASEWAHGDVPRARVRLAFTSLLLPTGFVTTLLQWSTFRNLSFHLAFVVSFLLCASSEPKIDWPRGVERNALGNTAARYRFN